MADRKRFLHPALHWVNERRNPRGLICLELTGFDFAVLTVVGRSTDFRRLTSWERVEAGKRSNFLFAFTPLRGEENEIGACSIGNSALCSVEALESNAVGPECLGAPTTLGP